MAGISRGGAAAGKAPGGSTRRILMATVTPSIRQRISPVSEIFPDFVGSFISIQRDRSGSSNWLSVFRSLCNANAKPQQVISSAASIIRWNQGQLFFGASFIEDSITDHPGASATSIQSVSSVLEPGCKP